MDVADVGDLEDEVLHDVVKEGHDDAVGQEGGLLIELGELVEVEVAGLPDVVEGFGDLVFDVELELLLVLEPRRVVMGSEYCLK